MEPVARDLEVLPTLVAHLHERLRRPMEAALGLLELGEVVVGHLRRRDLGREALELGAHHERLADLVEREHPHAYAAVRLERDEPERGEPPKRLAHGRSAHLELLGEVLLAERAAGRDLAGDDRLLERESDVVGLRPVGHG